jgi:hypothetical protein
LAWALLYVLKALTDFRYDRDGEIADVVNGGQL